MQNPENLLLHIVFNIEKQVLHIVSKIIATGLSDTLLALSDNMAMAILQALWGSSDTIGQNIAPYGSGDAAQRSVQRLLVDLR